MPEPGLVPLRAEVAALVARGGKLPPGADPTELVAAAVDLERRLAAAGADIAMLLRSVEATRQEWASRQPAPAAPQPSPPMRTDHLGASTYRDKGWSRIAAGDRPGAIAALRQALQLAPDDSDTEVMLGWALMLDDRLDDALATFGRVLVREPDHPMARVNLGYICLSRRIFGEAIEHLTRVLRDGSDRKATLYANYYLGLVYLDRGMFADALPFLRQALVLGPNLHEASYDLGRALWFDGQPDAAREVWRQSAASAGLNPWAARCAEVLVAVDQGGEVPRSRPR